MHFLYSFCPSLALPCDANIKSLFIIYKSRITTIIFRIRKKKKTSQWQSFRDSNIWQMSLCVACTYITFEISLQRVEIEIEREREEEDSEYLTLSRGTVTRWISQGRKVFDVLPEGLYGFWWFGTKDSKGRRIFKLSELFFDLYNFVCTIADLISIRKVTYTENNILRAQAKYAFAEVTKTTFRCDSTKKIHCLSEKFWRIPDLN